MAKTITFDYEGIHYTLEFTRKTIEIMEKNGFMISEIGDKPMTYLPKLFAGSFLANHRFTKPEVIDDIFSHMPNKEDLFTKLAEMYSEPITSLYAEPTDEAKNLTWGANW